MNPDIAFAILFPLIGGIGFGFFVGRIWHGVIKKYLPPCDKES